MLWLQPAMNWNSTCSDDRLRPTIRPDCPAEGSNESFGSDRVPQRSVFHYRRDQCVVDAGGKIVGVISHSDVSDKVAAENKCPAWMKASDIMTRDLVTVSPEMTMEECLRLMEQNTIFHLIVLDERQGFRGMLSVSDILRVVASDEKARADLLEAFIFPPR